MACSNCEDTIFNPKTSAGELYAANSDALGGIADPIEEEVRDVQRAKLAYSVLPIISFLDNSDATLKLLRKVSSLSPTDGSCINNKNRYTIGGGLTAVDRVRPGMSYSRATRKSEADENAAFDFIDTMHPDIDTSYLLAQADAMHKNWEIFGNIALRIKWYTVAGRRYMWFENVDCEYWRYWATEKWEAKVAVISDEWTLDYITRYPPEFVGVYPNITQNEQGHYETLIHVKNTVPGRPWYGLPQSHQALYYKYWEYQLGSYGTKGYANQWSARVFLETAGDNVEPGSIDAFRSNLRSTFTFSGKGRRVLHRHRNAADPETTVHEFRDETSHEFHATTADIAESKIIMAHDWHKVLMGIPTPGQLGGQNDFFSIFEVKYQTVIAPTQDTVMRPINIMLRIAREWFSQELDFNIALGNLFEQALDPTTDDAGNPIIQQVDNAVQ